LAAMGSDRETIWRLRGEALRNIVCVRETTASGAVALQVMLECEALLDEVYPDVRSALCRAAAIRADLVRRGWFSETEHTAA
jgi:hypothetical protein